MYVALDGDKIVGRGSGYVSMLFVDGSYHRRGIATALMGTMVCELKLRGFNKITVNSSPYGLPFYRHFGFAPTGPGQKKDGFIFTPMEYTPGEIWDVLDENGNKTGRYMERGRKTAAGAYNLVVHVWKHNGKGEWLIDRRAERGKSNLDGKWETTGGAALAGEDSLSAALREVKEELGIELDPAKGTLFHRGVVHRDDGSACFRDAWVFEWSGGIEEIHLQEGETCDAMWASTDKIREMMATGEFLSKWYYPYFEEMTAKWGAER